METSYQIVPIEKLRPSSLNPRHYINEAKMKELTESIRKVGVRVPLLVRPKDGHYEIAAGHRRFQAAQTVKLESAPVLIQEMNDTEFLELLTFENLHHEDIHPLDEANGYRTLMSKAGYDVPSIAAKLGKGKSESYIYQRLKLLDLIPEAQKKFFEDKITAGHAILIARLPANGQKEALKACFEYRDEGRSVRDLADWINRNIHLDLNAASFPKKDPTLLPSAGPCTTCQKRTGFVPQLFPDIQKKDTCTDRQCFYAKVKAFTEKWIKEKSEDADQPPLRLSGDYNYQSRKISDDPEKPIPSNLYHEIHGKNDRCESVREGIIVDGRGQGQVKQVCVDPKCEKHHGRRSYDSPETAKYRAHQRAVQEMRKNQEKVRLQILDAIMGKLTGDLSKEDFAFLADQLFDELWHEYQKKIVARHDLKPAKTQYSSDIRAPMGKYIEGCSKADLCNLLVEMALIRNIEPRYHYGQKKEDLILVTAERYKVDHKAIEKKMAAALREKKKAKAKSKKVQTSAKSKKKGKDK